MSFTNQDYVIIDFETANSRMDSICQIGMIKVKDGVVIDSYSSLIKPEPLYFSSMNISIHGIKASDVKNSKSFNELWPEIKEFIDDNTLIAHFAQFDMNCLCKTLNSYQEQYALTFTCSCRLAKELIQASSHKLTYLSETITKYTYKSHDALEDCYATYELITYMFKHYDVKKLVDSKFDYGYINNDQGYKGFIYKK